MKTWWGIRILLIRTLRDTGGLTHTPKTTTPQSGVTAIPSKMAGQPGALRAVTVE